jgi:hypothetical protein
MHEAVCFPPCERFEYESGIRHILSVDFKRCREFPMVVQPSIENENVSKRVGNRLLLESGSAMGVKCLKSHSDPASDLNLSSIHSVTAGRIGRTEERRFINDRILW